MVMAHMFILKMSGGQEEQDKFMFLKLNHNTN